MDRRQRAWYAMIGSLIATAVILLAPGWFTGIVAAIAAAVVLGYWIRHWRTRRTH